MSLYITKRDGTKEAFNADMINKSIERAARGLPDTVSKVIQVATDTRLTVYDGITTQEMDQATINAAIQNIKDDVDYDKIATRLFLKTIYKKVVGTYDTDDAFDLEDKHRQAFIAYVKKGVDEHRLHPDMIAKYDLERISEALKLERDELFVYSGVDGLINRYGMKDMEQKPLETPQFVFMRVAMGLAYHEDDPTRWAIRFYDKMSKHEYVAGGSTNLGAGTTRPALSNCFLLEIHDNMEHIAKSVSDVMLLSKGSGGLGASVTKLRAAGSPLKSNFGGVSTGPTTFAKVIDTAIRAIQRGGKKKGALCFYMETWHLDFPEFLDWKHNAGDDYLRMRTANTAAFISDEFMKRVESGAEWYLFDPAETPELNELYGKVFSKKYEEYIEKAERGEMRAFKKMPTRELYRKLLVALQTTSHPWLTWKDAINLRALNNNTGTIHMSNLCTEICLPQDKDNVAVCNLASLNLSAHVSEKQVNWQKLEESVRLAVRQLDNLIDINRLPIPEAEKSDKENRAIGLGVMGLADVFEKLGLAYDSEHAYNFADRIFEFVSYMAIDESANLAQVRGAYKNFEGSRWSKGMVPIDTLEILEERRGRPLTVDKTSHHKGLDWNILRAKVAKGIRNATLMAVAPNANIGLLVGTVPGIDARFSQVFSRNKISGKYLDINHNLVRDLKNMDLWETVKERIIELQGDISSIPEIPSHIKSIYKTSFTTDPYAYIEVAARAQKWVDQALSRNMYLETRDIDETMKIYSTAWEKGLKSTYYLHMKPRHTAEQSTVAVNKSSITGKKGFGAIAGLRLEEVRETVTVAVESSMIVEREEVPEKVIEEVVIETSAPMIAQKSEQVAVPMQTSIPEVAVLAQPVSFKRPAVQTPVAQPVMQAAPQPVQSVQAAPQTRGGFTIHMPENPADANICDGCQ